VGLGYNKAMTNNELQNYAEKLWESYTEVFPALVRFDCPRVELNARFKVTAGMCYVQENRVQLSTKHLAKFEHEMLTDTLPHELAHQIDYNLNGWPKNNRWHGKSWVIIMAQLGLNPSTYHEMKL
jgi:predicted SprT family Zn-dependent metalloprotease